MSQVHCKTNATIATSNKDKAPSYPPRVTKLLKLCCNASPAPPTHSPHPHTQAMFNWGKGSSPFLQGGTQPQSLKANGAEHTKDQSKPPSGLAEKESTKPPHSATPKHRRSERV
eukprot:g37732.t1